VDVNEILDSLASDVLPTHLTVSIGLGGINPPCWWRAEMWSARTALQQPNWEAKRL